ncbi:ABC transporter permease [Roseibium sp. Sym1]|uniref:ABC transporter permease n=1 Tax=Roseibium sp. Sym1 TaxID=3016006 RepID=UPI0022B451F2|nr:ABC transporter permease [Roseibium sp. Sym1]
MSESRNLRTSSLSYGAFVVGGGGLCLIFLIAPVVVAILLSFTSGKTLQFPPPGLSLQWYERLIDPVLSERIHVAAWNSTKIALLAVSLSALVTVPASYGMVRIRTRLANGLEPFLLAPLVLPSLVFGIALLITASLLGFRPSVLLVVVSHLVVFGPLMFRTTAGIAGRLDPGLEEASMLLGASRFATFRRIVLPLLVPGVLAGAFLIFVQSLDNVSMTLFLAPPGTSVLPLRMYAMLEQELDPRIAAISGVLIIVSFIALVAVQRFAPLLRDRDDTGSNADE